MNTRETNDSNELLLDVIIVALKGYVETNGKGLDDDSEEARKSGIINFSYLLGQSIRQWQIPRKNWHTSKNARSVWKMITGKDKIPYYQYKETFISAKHIFIPHFEGTTRDYSKVELKELQKDTKYVFNDIFIAEHTIPVADVRDALEEYFMDSKGKLSDRELKEGIKKILNAMHLTQMLKIEDRRIKNNSKRLKQAYTNGTRYDYLINSKPKDVYEDVCKRYYRNLSFTQKKNFDISKYKEKIQVLKDLHNGEIPDWAKSLDLEDPNGYTIKIAEKKTL